MGRKLKESRAGVWSGVCGVDYAAGNVGRV